jgi:hypothetical protein
MTYRASKSSAGRRSALGAINLLTLCIATSFTHSSAERLIPAMTAKVIHEFFKKLIIAGNSIYFLRDVICEKE